MTTGPAAPLPPWDIPALQERLQNFQARGLRGQNYSKKEVDQFFVDFLGLARAQARDIAQLRQQAEEAESAAKGYVAQLQAFAADNPDAVLMPLQVQQTMERAQTEADAMVADAKEFAGKIYEDAYASAERITADAQASARSIGHLVEPDDEDPEALADYLDAAQEYITHRRQEAVVRLSDEIARREDEIARLEATRTRVMNSEQNLKPEPEPST